MIITEAKLSKWYTCQKIIQNIIFNVRWLLILFYLGLIVILCLYAFAYGKQILEVISLTAKSSTDQLKLLVLDTIDIVMIANLVKMIIAGSYNSFVTKKHGYTNENISSGMLKIKISTSIIVVASIHLLKTFIGDAVDWNILIKDIVVYTLFILSALALGWLEYLHIKGEKIEHDLHKHSAHEKDITDNDSVDDRISS